MSAIASVTLLPIAALASVREAAVPRKSLFGGAKDHFPDVVAKQGGKVGEFPWSGFVLATLLPYLEEARGIDLMKSQFDELTDFLTAKRQTTHFILAVEHKRWLPDLDPAGFAEDELRDYYNQFNGTDEPDAGRPMLEGVRFLQAALAAIEPSTVALLSIG